MDVRDRILTTATDNVWVIGRGRTQRALDMSNVRRSGTQVIRDRLESQKKVEKIRWFKHCTPDKKPMKAIHANNTRAEERRFLSSHSEHSKR